MSATPVVSSILQLQLMNSAYAASARITPARPNQYRALVCVFLLGGNDSFNMLAPYRPTEHGHYSQVRSDLALPRNELLRIVDQNNRAFGLHPATRELRNLYNQGDLAFVANIGTLVRPTTLADYNRGIALPRGLFSHNDQQKAWQTSVPDSQQAIGWGGRMADMINDSVNRSSRVSMNIALNSVNIFQTGNVIFPYTVGPSGAQQLGGYDARGLFNELFSQATDGVLGQQYASVLKRSVAEKRRDAIDVADDFDAAVSGHTVDWPDEVDSSLAQQLRMVARTIAARSELDTTRQIFFVSAGGYDNHDELLNNQQRLLGDLSLSLKTFYDAISSLGVANRVTTFTASDFGRTLTSNGRGSDHAWGGNQIVLGGSVAGGAVYGDYPRNLANPQSAGGDSLDVGRGRLLPTTSCDEFHAELATWFGIPNDNNMEAILPNIRQFYDANVNRPPIGFMGA